MQYKAYKAIGGYIGTKANIEALALGAADEGRTAYATDTDEAGWYDGAAWQWGAGGAPGPQGPQGDQGDQGDAGTQGASGAQGDQGDTGVQGSAGAQGYQGNAGSQGEAGAQGYQGAAGTQGTPGVQGDQGYQGVAGSQGTQGVQGVQGAIGYQGLDGGGSNPSFYIGGALIAATDVAAYVVSNDMEIDAVYIYCEDPGSAGSTIVDVHLNGTTIFTTQGNRPTLAYDDANQVAKSGAPEVTSVSEEDVLTIDIDQVATGAANLTVVIAFVGGIGVQGYQGDTGPQGVQGAPGPQGDQGDQGIQGSAGGDSTYTDTYANIPAASNDGDLFFPSNGIAVYRDTGAVWSPWGPLYPLESIPTDGWSWVNQGTATVDTTYGGIYLTAPAADGVNLRCYVRAAPSTPYTITALVHLRMAFTGASDGIEAGLCFRESGTGEIATFGLQHQYPAASVDIWQFITTKFTNETTYSANYTRDWQSRFSAHPIWLRIADNGTNRICSWSMDGQHWIQVHSVGRTDFLTADQVGIYANAEHASLSMSMMVYSWRAA